VRNIIEKLGGILLVKDMRLREKANIESALQYTDWKIYGAGGAAELFGLKPTSSSPASIKWELGNQIKI